MRKIRKAIQILAAGLILSSCGPDPVSLTIENLISGYNGESTASAKYEAYASKAAEEGYDTIALLFQAASKSEFAHAEHFKRVLEALGNKTGEPVVGTFQVLTTAENLKDAIRGESMEVDSLYPGFLSQAEGDNLTEARKAITWATDTEKKHRDFFTKALEMVTSGSESALPSGWYVCPVCGNTYDALNVKDPCDFCLSGKQMFLTFSL